jgi:hypothetical protein
VEVKGLGEEESGERERGPAGRTIFYLIPTASWRIPQGCATDMLTMAHHIGVRHAYHCVVQKKSKCNVDSNMHIAQWFVCWLFDIGRCQVRTLDLPLFLFLQKPYFRKFKSTILKQIKFAYSKNNNF